MPIYYDRYGRPIRTSGLRPEPLRAPVNGGRWWPDVSPVAEPPRWPSQLEQLQNALIATREHAERLQAGLAQARQQVEALQAELAEARQSQPAPQPEDESYRDKYLRLAAEFEDSRKRLERLYEHQAGEERERLLRDFLPLADNLERALAHAGNDDSDALRQGMELTLRAFNDTLARHGVRPIRPQPGEAFDPTWHEAIAMLPGQDLEAGSIAHVQETGYALGEKLLRPAKVVVAGGEA